MIRNFLFIVSFFIGIIFISIIFLPSLLMPKNIVIYGGKLMGHWSSFCLKFFLSTKITIKGAENINRDQKFFVAASHQSMFETFFLQTILDGPIFILKKELLLIPIFGWYLKKIGSISIQRNKITKENLGFFEDILEHTSISNRPIIIFPQATRVLPNERPPFKKGVAKIYEMLKIDCLPIAINSGNVWPKIGEMRPNKEIVISILKSIPHGLIKDSFLEILEKNIYDELDKIS